ncbi:Hypothetical protein KVN_LOCUS147 [uncultured virus]|nr:Hypothetical protein KVN_LOCUS147 [uncultured virus]
MYKSIIIFDWDDTLFPTTWLTNNGINLVDPIVQYKYLIFFSKLDLILFKLLSNATKISKVIIVTNAMEKWVKLSLTILPNTKLLVKNKIQIISARDKYNKILPMNSNIWKKLIFEKIISNEFNSYSYMQNIISVGDADYEFNALVNLYDDKCNTKRILKNIKFIQSPSFDMLIDELEILNKFMLKIIYIKRHLDLKFKKK